MAERDPIEYGKPIPVRLPQEVIDRIEVIAKRLGEARSTVMRIAMRLGLEGLEKAFKSGSITAETLRSAAYPEHTSGAALAADKPPGIDVQAEADRAAKEEAEKILAEPGSKHSAPPSGSGAPSAPAGQPTPTPGLGASVPKVSYRQSKRNKGKQRDGK